MNYGEDVDLSGSHLNKYENETFTQQESIDLEFVGRFIFFSYGGDVLAGLGKVFVLFCFVATYEQWDQKC